MKAFYRLSKRLKARFPRLAICLLLDGLYAGGPTFKLCEDYDWKYLIVLRDDDLPNVHRSFAAVLPHSPECHKQLLIGKQGRIIQEYAWVENLTYTDTKDCQHSLKVIDCLESEPNSSGQIKTTHYKWLTNFTLTSYNMDQLANQGGRLRWRSRTKALMSRRTANSIWNILIAKIPSLTRSSTCFYNWAISCCRW